MTRSGPIRQGLRIRLGSGTSGVTPGSPEVQVLILSDELTMITPDADNPWASRIILKPVGPSTLRIVAIGLRGEPIGELLTFEMDGKVVRVRTPYRYWLPVE